MEVNLAKQLVITSVRPQARDIKSFDLSLAEPGEIYFLPGQVAILKVPNEAPAYFAFASAPEDQELEVLVKKKIGASNRGKKRSPETIERLRNANLGKVMSAESRAKMRASQLGKKRSPESVAKSAATFAARRAAKQQATGA